jgi:hypothetical protein
LAEGVVADVLMPPLGLLIGRVGFADLFRIAGFAR